MGCSCSQAKEQNTWHSLKCIDAYEFEVMAQRIGQLTCSQLGPMPRCNFRHAILPAPKHHQEKLLNVAPIVNPKYCLLWPPNQKLTQKSLMFIIFIKFRRSYCWVVWWFDTVRNNPVIIFVLLFSSSLEFSMWVQETSHIFTGTDFKAEREQWLKRRTFFVG